MFQRQDSKRLSGYSIALGLPAIALVLTLSPLALAQEATPSSSSAPLDQAGKDAVSEWLENNGSLYNLFLDPKPVVIETPASAPKSVVNPNPKETFEAKSRTKPFIPPPEALNSNDAAAQIKAVMNDLKFGKSCDSFATEKGFGAWGRAVIEEISSGKAPALVGGTEDLRRACPNYDYLGFREKSYVWVKVLATMSFLESSCNPNADVPGIKAGRRAVGLLQLHGGSEQNYAEDCRRGASRSPRETLRCGIQMLNDQITRSGALFSRESYWGVLRPQGDLVKTHKGKRRALLARMVVGSLKELPLCQRK